MASQVEVFINERWETVKKAGQFFELGTQLRLKNPGHQYVGRGALKLQGALDRWPEIIIEDKLALDIGSSTGGFTEVLIERGAQKVLALDVGKNQLHEKLRHHPKVFSLEKQHVLKMDANRWKEIGWDARFSIIVTDVSFISVLKLIPVVQDWLEKQGDWILLLKPQFELEASKLKKGIVKSMEFQEEALQKVIHFVELHSNLDLIDRCPSPILGSQGNKEFFLWLKKT